MKLSTLFAAAAALMLATSCGILGLGSSTETATTSGQASGAALKNLYTQYKTDGKLDMTNLSNIVNLATLSQAVGELKDAGTVDKSEYLKEFATGLITGSSNLVTESNSTSVVSNLTNLAGIDLSSVTSAATALIASGAAQATTVATTAATTATETATAATAAATETTASTASTVASALAQVSSASSEVSSAVSTLGNIFSLFSSK